MKLVTSREIVRTGHKKTALRKADPRVARTNALCATRRVTGHANVPTEKQVAAVVVHGLEGELADLVTTAKKVATLLAIVQNVPRAILAMKQVIYLEIALLAAVLIAQTAVVGVVAVVGAPVAAEVAAVVAVAVAAIDVEKTGIGRVIVLLVELLSRSTYSNILHA